MEPKCWLIGEANQHLLDLLQAASRGLEVNICRSGTSPTIADAPTALIAIDLNSFRCLAPSAVAWLGELIRAGATCYLRGGWPVPSHFSISPLLPVDFQVVAEHKSPGYKLTDHPLLPAALRGESREGSYNISVARGLSARARPIALLRASDGSMAPSLFVIEHGAGVIICDLSDGGEAATTSKNAPTSLLSLLEDTARRLEIIGPLVAFDRAAGRDPDRAVGCDIVIDDRPVNLDYLNVNSLRSFLGYLTSRCPAVHVDFGWTPDQTRPSQRYIETAKQFDAGFFWHGMLHHIDHRTLPTPEHDLTLGRRLVKEISERYQVRFQPVMVFPYEKDTDACVALLKREGFIAKAQGPGNGNWSTAGATGAVTSLPAQRTLSATSDGFVVLARDAIETVTRDRMLARAGLGMPIIVAGHPRDAGLRRLARIRRHRGAGVDFDQVVDFFAEKKLRPSSLEKLAREALAAGANPA